MEQPFHDTVVEKVDIINIGISNISLPETIRLFNYWIKGGFKKRVCVTPVNCLVWGNQNAQFANLYNTADLTLCDGVPILWASKFLGTPLKGRVTGLDLFPDYIKECAKEGNSMYFLGAKEGVGKSLKKQFEQLYPTIKIVGHYSPPFADEFSKEENEKIIHLIHEVQPSIYWLSLTAPNQDICNQKNCDRPTTNTESVVGQEFCVTSGKITRAPKWMQKTGLEWFFRFLNEPKRLFRRYFIEAPLFFPLLLKQKLQQKPKSH